jgi:hypothetical protein
MWFTCHLSVTIAAVGIIGSPEPAQKGPVDKGPGTLTAARTYLEGRWSLVSFEVFPPGTPPITVKGQGTLTYDGFGNLDMQIRVDEPTGRKLTEAGIVIADGKLSTTGRTVIDVATHTLSYVVEGQPPRGAPSGPLALNRPRYWAVEGNVLTLTTKDAEGRPVSVGRWEKAR